MQHKYYNLKIIKHLIGITHNIFYFIRDIKYSIENLQVYRKGWKR
jgi:hypothetical protein